MGRQDSATYAGLMAKTRQLQQGESILSTWSAVTLTNRRVLYAWDTGDGGGGSQAIQLDAVEYTAVERQTQPGLLGLAVLLFAAALMAFFTSSSEVGMGLGFVGLILIAMYQASKKVQVVVAASADRIECELKGAKAGNAEAIGFLDNVDVAAVAARRSLTSTQPPP